MSDNCPKWPDCNCDALRDCPMSARDLVDATLTLSGYARELASLRDQLAACRKNTLVDFAERMERAGQPHAALAAMLLSAEPVRRKL